MQNVAGIRRNIKNLAHNYSDAQVKVREATSNDPWGPSSTLMSEIADLTYNVMAFTEIMQLIWKRLNDHGKNWRHVYKSLVLLEYLIKTGSEKVAQQCKDNIHNIQTLKDFQYYEEAKDQGMNVREKAKQLVLLLKDEERLRNERARALKAKERFAQASGGFGSEGTVYQGNWGSQERPPSEVPNKELESARPQTVGEEELQLQLALAMSREEAEQEEQRRRSDDVRLQLALSQSQHEFQTNSPPSSSQQASHMLDLLDVNLSTAPAKEATLDPWCMPQRPPPRPQGDGWSSTPSVSSVTSPQQQNQASGGGSSDPWAPISQPQPHRPPADPWRPSTSPVPVAGGVAVLPHPPPQQLNLSDPWSPNNTDHSSPHLSSPGDLEEFDVITNRDKHSEGHGIVSNGNSNASNNNNNNNGSLSPDPFDFGHLSSGLAGAGTTSGVGDMKQLTKKSPHSFLGENSSLVNLDNLVTVSNKTNHNLSQSSGVVSSAAVANPFTGLPQHPIQSGTTAPATAHNLFQQQVPVRPSINQIRQQTTGGFINDDSTLPSPLVPTANPFLS